MDTLTVYEKLTPVGFSAQSRHDVESFLADWMNDIYKSGLYSRLEYLHINMEDSSVAFVYERGRWGIFTSSLYLSRTDFFDSYEEARSTFVKMACAFGEWVSYDNDESDVV